MDRFDYRRAVVVMGVCLLSNALLPNLHAGGCGFNTIVVVNQASSNSCELGNYFCERRLVPPSNVLRINWAGGNTSWTSNDFQTTLVTPLLAMLAEQQLTSQIDYVVLSMDIPFQTIFGSAVDSTTSALFYGSRLGNGSDPLGVTNSYGASEADFRQAIPVGAPGYSFLTTMITGDSLAQAEQLVDQGVNGDQTFPQQPAVLGKSSDTARNIRYPLFDNAIFNTSIRGVSTLLSSNTDSLWPQPGFLGYETGLAQYTLSPGTFVPGSIGDSLTSFGGIIFGANDQTNLLAFIDAGAAGSYGTVAEPNNDTQKFPNPQVYFYQARGFSLAESYYQSVNVPYLGLMVAEPLSAPFARQACGLWVNVVSNSVLSGTQSLSIQFATTDASRPLQQIDLFVDGVFYATLTNLPPTAGNLLSLSLNGYPFSYTVPPNATLGSVASDLAALINNPVATNATQVKAILHGDRIELQYLGTNISAQPFYVADNSTNSQGSSYSVNYLPAAFPPAILPVGFDRTQSFRISLQLPTTGPYVVQASTDLVSWTPVFTNTAAGLLDFYDVNAMNYPSRFYRVVGPVRGQAPVLSASGLGGDGSFQMSVRSGLGEACALLASSNLVDWSGVWTNLAGGPWGYADTNSATTSCQFYRAWLVPPAAPAVTVQTGLNGSSLVQVSSAVQPYTVAVSNDPGQWTVLDTNFAIGQFQTYAGSSIGTAAALSTWLTPSRPTFMNSSAFGRQGYTVIANTPAAGAYIQFTFTKTNAQVVVVGVTNQSGGTSSAMASQLYDSINANPALQGADGVAAEDFIVNPGGAITFNLRARSPGYAAAQIQAVPKVYKVIMSTPSGGLTQNISDLQPRNHLYVTAGATGLGVTFPLDTTTLMDGCHSLTAVAYEGSDVRTQSKVTVPVWIQNTPLSATITLIDLTNSAPAQGIYHIEVAANADDVSSITLYSTGGALETVTNLSDVIFDVDGSYLCAGLHPFYAIIQSDSGFSYRTETHCVRLQ